jgi:hypothetical protein
VPREAAIPVQDQADMAGKRLPLEFSLESPLVQTIERG